VDALWPRKRLVVELDGFAFHRHRAAFERDRARDAGFLAAGFAVLRLTHRRLLEEPEAVAAQLRGLLAAREQGEGPSS
jgi:very-short-patch-repair endonuclease